MLEVRKELDALIHAIRNSNVYRSYVKAEEAISRNSELKKRIDEYRRLSFETLNMDDPYERIQEIRNRFADLYTNPEAMAYLEAEHGVCVAAQQIKTEILDSIPVCIPE